MGNKPNFNENYAKSFLQKFVEYYRKGYDILDAYNDQLNLLNSLNANEEKRKILENCKSLFEDSSLKEKVDFEIATICAEIKTTNKREAYDSEIVNWLLQCFPEEISGVDKRTYDMSQVATNGMLTRVKTPQGNISKVVAYVSFEDQQKKRNQENAKRKPPEKILKDRYGNPIHIQFMGCLAYRTPSSNQYIYKHRITTKTIDGVVHQYEKFSNMDIFAMNYDEELCNLVVSELLSEKNLKRSNADDYIGEISEESTLKPGTEKFEYGIYTYQMSPKYALVYNGERIEAIKAYKQQEAQKKAMEQTPTPPNAGDGPEL